MASRSHIPSCCEPKILTPPVKLARKKGSEGVRHPERSSSLLAGSSINSAALLISCPPAMVILV